ncbi:hypothetical protein DFAR_1620005 [Desulfarculales bacterium]
MDIWQVWNDSLAQKINQQGINLFTQADYFSQAVKVARGRDDRTAL